MLWWHRVAVRTFCLARLKTAGCGLYFKNVLDLCFGEVGDEYQAKEKLALIPNMIEVQREDQGRMKTEASKNTDS